MDILSGTSPVREWGYNRFLTQRILIVEDEIELANVMRDYLVQAGFEVDVAHNGDEALSRYDHKSPDLVLLDLNLPGMDGLDVAREIRRHGTTPIIMVTARVDETDRIIGLELGADDYVVKPYSPKEVVARVRAVLRRAQGPHDESRALKVRGIEIDILRHKVYVDDQEVEFTPSEFALLTAFAREPGRAFSRLQLLEALHDEVYEGYERTIDAHVKNIRAKIEEDPRNPEYIQTVFGIGYRFTDE